MRTVACPVSTHTITPTLAGNSTCVYGIDDSTPVVRYAYDSAGHAHAFLLTPVSVIPVPGAFLLAVAGTAFVAVRRLLRKL